MTAVRKNSTHGYDHVYQITADRGICFYSSIDCLVWFTLLCILARKYGIRILSLCIMFNHYHIQLRAPSAQILSAFMRDLTARFTRMYNRQYGLSGHLFDGQFRNAPKFKEQKIQENFIYICNNPVVKQAVKHAGQYRWNFLAYMDSSHPFSTAIQPDTSSDALKQVLASIRERRKADHPVDYLFFRGIYNQLIDNEKRQVLDYIVTTYNVIDYLAIRQKWGDYPTVCKMLSMVSGSEFDLTEEAVKEDYRHYYKMIRLAGREGYAMVSKRLNALSPSEQRRLAQIFRYEADASPLEIAKFLHTVY